MKGERPASAGLCLGACPLRLAQLGSLHAVSAAPPQLVVAPVLAGPIMTLPKKMFDNILMEIDPTIAAVSVMQILLVSSVLVLIGRFGRGLRDSAR